MFKLNKMAENSKSVPFCEKSHIYLMKQIKKFPILENKKSDVMTMAAKKRAWEEITRHFNSNGNFQRRSLVQLRKHWDNVKTRRKKELVKETRDLGKTEGELYKPLRPSCPEVEMVAPHPNYLLGYQWDGDTVAMEDATTKSHKISIPEVTATLSTGSTLAGTSGLDYFNTAEITTSSSASLPLSFLTPTPQQSSPSPPSSSPSRPTLTPLHTTKAGVLQKTVYTHKKKEKAEKELYFERLAEARLNREEAEKRQQRGEELHRLEMEQLRIKVEFEAWQMEAKTRHLEDMHRETLQAAKDRHEQEYRLREELHLAQLKKLLEPLRHQQ